VIYVKRMFTKIIEDLFTPPFAILENLQRYAPRR
jgi:hypothetical protein